MPSVKKLSVFLCMVLVVLVATGCVTREQLDLVANSLDSRVRSLESEMTGMADIKSIAESNRESSKFVRKKVADVDDNMTALLSDVQKLRGATEELSVKVAALQSSSGTQKNEEVTGKIDDILRRIQSVENYLGMGKKVAPQDSVLDQERVSLQEEIDKEKEYSEALTIFKERNYVDARKKFQDFLGAFADTEYSDNAQFWIGECYYFEGNYEKAILEYEKVVQNYSKGNKVPDALLKQAFSFLKLGDRSSSKLLFQRIIKDYPNTTSARRAREQLLSIK